MHAATTEWIEIAEQDFEIAQRALKPGDDPLTKAASFHCQQCAENYLKAFLVEHNIHVRRTHLLIELAQLCLTVDPEFKNVTTELATPEAYAVQTRYPGFSVTLTVAQAALAAAARVRAKLSLD